MEKTKAAVAVKAATLNSLKDQLHSLNMRMRLAMRNHDEKTQAEIKEQMTEVQDAIDCMCLGGHQNRN